MKTRDWQGYWICGNDDPNVAPYLRKSFVLEEVPQSAVLYLCGLGWHELYVNGVKYDDRVLAPTVTQFDRHARYLSYDLTGRLRKGRNAIVVLLGSGWYHLTTEDTWALYHAGWVDHDKMLCDLECDGKILLSSDNTWKTASSPIVFNQLRNGEKYDARKEIDGVLEPDFDDSQWGQAGYCNPPGGILEEEDMEPCRVCQIYEGKPNYYRPDQTIFDFGTNLTGWCEIEVEGEAGDEVLLRYAERLTDDGNTYTNQIDPYVFSGEFQTDRYILKGKGREIWHARFTYHGFRYCSVIIPHKPMKIIRVTAHFLHNDFPVRGHFQSSSQMLNTLQKLTLQSYLSNYTGIPTDCPHREKNGWTGDAQVAMETGIWNFGNEKAAAGFVEILADTQRVNGQLPGIAPTGKFGYNWGSGPAWDIALFELPYRIALFRGDDSLFRKYLPNMELYLDYCRSMAHEGGLVDFGLGDWCCSDYRTMTPSELTSSAYYYYAAKLVSRYVPKYTAVAESIADAINRKYYKGDGIYANGERTAMACALYFGFAKDPELCAKRLVEAVRKLDHTTGFGILGAKYVPRMLAEYGYMDDAYQLITQDKFPSWGYWAKIGATTLREAWNSSSSQNHIMFGDISAWMYQYVAGIMPLDATPGFRHFRLAPQFPKGLDSAEAEYDSPLGLVRSSWKRNGNAVECVFQIPKGATAELRLPGKDAVTLTEADSGKVFLA